MSRHCAVAAALLLVASASRGAGPGQVSPLEQAALRLDPGTGLVGLDLYDGRAKQPVTLTRRPNGWQSRDGSLTVSLSRDSRGGRAEHTVRVTNSGPANAWLLLRAYAQFASGGPWQYFNGNFSARPRRPTVRTSLAYTMPVVALYDRQRGRGLGLDPTQLFSYVENGVLPGQKQQTCYYGVKLVVSPGTAETVRFVTFDFPAPHGERSVVAAYQGLHPQAFTPAADGDPRLQTKGEAGSSVTWYRPSPEAARRSLTGADWCYAPVKIPGDWFGRPEYWDKYNEDVADEKRLSEHYGTLEHWHRYLLDTFTRVQDVQRVAPYFYIINWTYERLAQEQYADALVTDPAAQNRIAPWVTNKGPDVRVFLWGNRHAEQFHRDLTDIWRSYPISGFGHDVATGDVKYRGPAAAQSPGRAWDEQGEYCDVSVCIAKTGDFVHALPRKQWRAGFWASGCDHIYSIAVRSDAGAIEEARYMLAGLDDRARYLRYILGSKAIQLFSGDSRDNTTQYYNPEQTSRDDIKLMYRRVQLSALQACLKWGLLPCADLALGWQESYELLDLADRELFPYPWQLLPAAVSDAPVALARYGRGRESRFAVVNPRGVAVTTRVSIDAAEVGARMLYAVCLPGEAQGTGRTLNTLSGSTVTLEVSLPAAGSAVVLPVAEAPRGLSGSVAVGRATDPTDGLRLMLPPGAEPLVPPGYERAQSKPPQYRLRRTLFLSTESALLDFFSAAAGTPRLPAEPISLIVPSAATASQRRSAEAVQEYFRFYSEEVLQQPRLLLPAVPQADGKQVRFEEAPRPRIGLDAGGTVLTIAGPEPALLDTTRELLRLLDRRYPFYGQIARWVHARPRETELRKQLGLAGGTVLNDGRVLTTPLGASLWNQVGKGPAYGKPW